MNLLNSSLRSHESSKSEAPDELADEPPNIGNHPIHSKTICSPQLKTFAISLVLLAQLHRVSSSTLDPGLEQMQDMHLVARSHPISHQVTQELSRPSAATSFISIILIPILVLASGLFAGLTIGYMSLDSTQLAVLAKSGTPAQKILAQRVVPLRKNGHMLLITLLIANMIANETLPIVSEKVLGGGVQAIIISTVLVIIFSEIIPQTVCATHALRIGAIFAKPVQILVYLFYPVVWPISSLLTKLLGEHRGTIYRPEELKELVNLHARQSNHGGDLAADVVTIIGSAIDLQERVVEASMTSLNNCFMLNINAQLSYETMSDILASGHSRIPVYESVMMPSGQSRRIVGALLTKQLILIDPEDGIMLREFPLNPLPHVASDMPLLNILNSFQEGRSHLAVVCPSVNTMANVESCKSSVNQPMDNPPKSKLPWWRTMFIRKANPLQDHLTHTQQLDALTPPLAIQPSKGLLTDQPMGIISLEDVLEALLNEPIYDETDLDEHGHMAVPPYVPPEAFAALRRPNSGSVPSPVYDSKVLHQSSRDALQIETEMLSAGASTHSPDLSKPSASPRLLEHEFGSHDFTNHDISCNIHLIRSHPNMVCSDNANKLAMMTTRRPSEVVSQTVQETELSKGLRVHGQDNLQVHLTSCPGDALTFEANAAIASMIDNCHFDPTSNVLPESNRQDTAVNNTGEPSSEIRGKNHLNGPQLSTLGESEAEIFPDGPTF